MTGGGRTRDHVLDSVEYSQGTWHALAVDSVLVSAYVPGGFFSLARMETFRQEPMLVLDLAAAVDIVDAAAEICHLTVV